METIGIIGIGKMGLCFALNLERSGFRVIGMDIDPSYVNEINNRTFHSSEPQVSELLKASINFSATTDLKTIIDGTNIIFIAVATPTSDEGYDHSQVDSVLERIISFGKQPLRKHLIIACTTIPGYCDQAAAKVAPFNISLSYNPEFIAQGSIIHDQQYPDQVLIGEADKNAGDAIEGIYRRMTKSNPRFCRMSRLSAEICKLATNCYLTTKISFANAIGDLAILAGAEPEKILNAIGADSRIGDKYLKHGYGFGGPCFPRDNRALRLFADKIGYELLISQATDKTNAYHLDFMLRQWMKNHEDSKEIVFDYVTYKPGSVILEESQQLALAVKLAHAGKKVRIRERKPVIKEVKKIYGDLFLYEERS
ncbi:MAG TPA: nucleotide sugar dehydrogenase [Chitinophagales bacterium]|nr:nucleotide sugar dehydrogenase [Chitinophagales bacterium]